MWEAWVAPEQEQKWQSLCLLEQTMEGNKSSLSRSLWIGSIGILTTHSNFVFFSFLCTKFETRARKYHKTDFSQKI